MVMSLEDVARELHGLMGWRSHVSDALRGRIDFVSCRGRRFLLDLAGCAHEVVRGAVSPHADPDAAICFREVLRCERFAWAHDVGGNVVAVRG